MLWDIATTGRTKYADGKELVAGAAGWLDVVKFLYAQIDGPPRTDIDLTSGGRPFATFREVLVERPAGDGDDTAPLPD